MNVDVNYGNVMPITGVQFSILVGPSRLSIIDGIDSIQQTELYDGQLPRIGGLIPPALGGGGWNSDCPLCGLEKEECVGHNPNNRERAIG